MVPSRAIDFSLPKSPVQTEMWPTKPPIQWVHRDLVLAVKRLELEDDTHFLLVPKLETCEPTIPTPLCPYGLQRDNIL